MVPVGSYIANQMGVGTAVPFLRNVVKLAYWAEESGSNLVV
jgi:hypothetical protein